MKIALRETQTLHARWL